MFVADKSGVINMSLFARHAAAECAFAGPDAWVVLSPLEQAIRRKVETAGTPLRDWDVQINYGIKTGYNDAFIVTTERREAILAACRTEAERERTAALIRPILRGRDIRRYGYQWAGLWIINTHNGVKGQLERIHIEDYPAVKAHLDQYWDKISTRTDKGDTPYNLRNCAYMGDFARPHIIWIELSDTPKFALAQNILSANTVFFLSGEHILHLLGLLNSKLVVWYFQKCLGTTSGVGTNRWLKYTVEQIPMAKASERLETLVDGMSKSPSGTTDAAIDRLVCELYDLDTVETEFILNSAN